MWSLLERAILKTIVYADVFDYPLKKEEIGKRLIEFRIKNSRLAVGQVELRIKKLKKYIKQKNGFYLLKDRDKIVYLRKERGKYSQKKIKIAQEISGLLKFIPTVKLMGITGALSVNNAKKEDDIDLFIITSSGLLWITRFLVTLLVEATGRRRHPHDKHVNDKICLNMFVDEDYLEIPEKEQDLFSAHEVAQMKPLWEKDNIYQKFLLANSWVKDYLPNAVNIKYQRSKTKNIDKKSNILSFIEYAFKKFQLWYMRKKRTTEIIRNGIIRFHPQDARERVMKKYKEQLKEFNL